MSIIAVDICILLKCCFWKVTNTFGFQRRIRKLQMHLDFKELYKVTNAFVFQRRIRKLQMHLDFREEYKSYKCIYKSKKNKKVTNAFVFQRTL